MYKVTTKPREGKSECYYIFNNGVEEKTVYGLGNAKNFVKTVGVENVEVDPNDPAQEKLCKVNKSKAATVAKPVVVEPPVNIPVEEKNEAAPSETQILGVDEGAEGFDCTVVQDDGSVHIYKA